MRCVSVLTKHVVRCVIALSHQMLTCITYTITPYVDCAGSWDSRWLFHGLLTVILDSIYCMLGWLMSCWVMLYSINSQILCTTRHGSMSEFTKYHPEKHSTIMPVHNHVESMYHRVTSTNIAQSYQVHSCFSFIIWSSLQTAWIRCKTKNIIK